MYWWAKYKRINLFWTPFLLVMLLYSCAEELSTSTNNRQRHIDLPAFFQSEVNRLKQENPSVQKTVSVGEGNEQQDVTINDWSTELASFLSIDLNKAAYRDDIQKDSIPNLVTYRIDNPDLDIDTVSITYESGQPVAIQIVRHIDNFLYNTQERLQYHKRQGYSIEKKQSVWILGDNTYYIEGKFSK